MSLKFIFLLQICGYDNKISKNEVIKLQEINFPGASTQMPQGHLPPATQERGIRPNLTTFGTSLHDAEHRGIKPSLD